MRIWTRDFHILATAGGFKKIARKGGGGWIFYPKFYLHRGHVKSNVQSIADIISFRTYDNCFHHDVRGHGAGGTLPKSMRADLLLFFFANFPTDFPVFFTLCLILLIFLFIAHLSHIFVCLFTETSRAFEKKQCQSRFSELNFSSFFRHLKASGVLPVCV